MNVPRKRGRPARLTREEIVGVAVDMPVERLSMTAVARRLRVTDAALYHHFPCREDLLREVAHVLTADLELPDEAMPWQDWMRAYARAVRAALERHPGTAAFLSGHGPTGARQLGMIETALRVMTRDGLPLRRARLLYAALVSHVVAFVERNDRLARDRRAGRTEPSGRLAGEILAAGGHTLPLLRSVAGPEDALDIEEQFDFVLEALVAAA